MGSFSYTTLVKHGGGFITLRRFREFLLARI